MNKTIKKEPRKLSTAGQLILIFLVLILTLYNTAQNITTKADMIEVKNQLIEVKDDVKQAKWELEAIHEHVADANSYYLQNSEPWEEYETFQACDSGSTFKSYMSYNRITATTSKQYALQLTSDTNSDGMRTTYNRVQIAIAGFEVGDMLNITLSSGDIINAIVGDIKADTDCLHSDGSLVEFIVDVAKMDLNVRNSGNYNDIYTGSIELIELTGNYFE